MLILFLFTLLITCSMYQASKKTRSVNAFIRTAVIRPRDLYAKYGQRANIKGIYSTAPDEIAPVIPNGGSVIDQMILGQNTLRDGVDGFKQDE